MRYFIRRFNAFLVAAAVLAPAASCSEKAQNAPKLQTFTVETLTEHSFTPVIADIPSELTAIFNIERLGDGELLIIGSTEEKAPVFYTADMELNKFEPLEILDFPVGFSYAVKAAGDGSIIGVSAGEDGSFVISKYGNDGAFVSSNELAFNFSADGLSLITSLASADGENCIVGVDYSYYAVSTDGEVFGELQTGSAERTIEQIGRNSAGEAVCAVNFEDGVQLLTADIPEASLGVSETVYRIDETIPGEIIGAEGDYSAFIPAKSGIYGIGADNIPERLVDYASLGIHADEIGCVCALDGGSFAISVNNYSTGGTEMLLLTEQEVSAVQEKQDITVAVMYSDDILEEAAVQYNISHDDSRIQIIQYSLYNTEDDNTKAVERLKMDIVSGKVPDIIDISMITGLGLEKFGMYTDLYEFIDNDEELSRESFVPGVLRANEKDGMLISMPTEFLLRTTVGKAKFVDEFADWGLEEIKSAAEKYPDKLLYGNYEQNSARGIFFSGFNYMEFIDFDNYTCNFNNERFIGILEFCRQYPPSSEPIAAAQNVRNDSALIGFIKGLSFGDTIQSIEEYTGGDELTVIDSSMQFSGRYAITESCENKDDAWDYIKEMLEYENDRIDIYVWSFSVLTERLDREAAAAQNISEELIEQSGGNLRNLTDDEIRTVKDMIYTAEAYESDNFPVYLIVDEEVERCFNGETTPQECAEMIQNRVSIYLAEQQ